jgi:molybdopterin/thiamine biosynthesis adenylyltransferase
VLTGDELERYDRQIMLTGFGEEGQAKLKRARVFIAGAGGLGSPVSIYLATAGVGTIRIVDRDKIELSNLNRQILHWDENIGMEKTDSAAEKLQKINPGAKIEAIAETITEANISELVGDCDLIVDAMDNLATRYLLNKTAIEKDIPFFHGAVYGLEGRAITVIPGKTACIYCLYHGATLPKEKFPVIGVTPGVIGCIQATEVIKYIVGLGELLTNRLLIYDALGMKFTELKVKKDPNCKHCGNLSKLGEQS